MKLTNEIDNLGLPDYIKFGLELEVENVNYNKVKKELKAKCWHADKDMSLTDSGVESVSPVLFESDEHSVWQELKEVCSIIEDSPNDVTRQAYTDNTCGGHIHFDASIFLKDPEIMKNFLRLWAESEELVYKMCNGINNPIRPSAINQSHITLIDVCKTLLKSPIPEDTSLYKSKSLKDKIALCRAIAKNVKSNASKANRELNVVLDAHILSQNGMATPIARKILKQIKEGKLKVGKPKSKIYREVMVKSKLTPERYYGLNLANIGSKKKNTVEFRMHNGTKELSTIKENVFLDASLIRTAVEMTRNPEKVKTKLIEFYQTDISEEEKVDRFLNLIMEEPEDREVYKARWQSVKDAPVFQTEGSKNFVRDRFQRDDLQEITYRVPATGIKKAFDFIKQLKEKVAQKLNGDKEDMSFDYR